MLSGKGCGVAQTTRTLAQKQPSFKECVIGSMTEKTCGASGSENAGMSNERQVRILSAARLRFPGAGSSAQGKSGPKARPRGVVDGQQVDIPVLHPIVMSEGGTQEASSAWCWKPCSSAESGNESNAYFLKDKA